MMVIWSDLIRSETWVISRYKNRLGCCDKCMACVQVNALEDAMCKRVIHILDTAAPKPRFWSSLSHDPLCLCMVSNFDSAVAGIRCARAVSLRVSSVVEFC